MNEAQLIDGCRRGEREAQRRLYERYGERIYRLTLRLAGNAEDAFDLTQETFVRAFQRIASFDGRSGIGTWLYRVATNEAFQLFRRGKTEQRHLRIYGEQRIEPKAGTANGHGPDVEAALSCLSDEHRTILLLKYQENMSYEQIADVLQCSPGTVASRLNRARTELRTLLKNASAASREEPGGPPHPT
jgi:RNA polymerase sigma-70 factor (ECF subfamily)